MGQAEELAAQLQARQLVETNVAALAPPTPPPVSEAEKPDEEKGGLGKMISKMMQDPDTRKFIREQQRMMMDQMYAPLVKQMGLTPDEAAQFKDMLADNGMKAAEQATSVFGGSGSTNRTEMLSSLTAATEELRRPGPGLPGRRPIRAIQGLPGNRGRTHVAQPVQTAGRQRLQLERPADRGAADLHEGGEEERRREHRPAAR